MDHTTNYNLNQWEATDRVTRADFNADNTKIDAALKTVADAAGAAPKFAVGSYTGDNTSTRTISVGFTPKAVLVCDKAGRMNAENVMSARQSWYGGLAITGSPVVVGAENFTLLELTSGGFTVHNGEDASLNLRYYANSWGVIYHYIALG